MRLPSVTAPELGTASGKVLVLSTSVYLYVLLIYVSKFETFGIKVFQCLERLPVHQVATQPLCSAADPAPQPPGRKANPNYHIALKIHGLEALALAFLVKSSEVLPTKVTKAVPLCGSALFSRSCLIYCVTPCTSHMMRRNLFVYTHGTE